MKRLVPLVVGALVLIAFALAQRAIGFASTENPVAQAATAIPLPAPIVTPIPTLTPLPIATPLPVATVVPSVAP